MYFSFSFCKSANTLWWGRSYRMKIFSRSPGVIYIYFRAMFVEKFLLWKVFPVCCLGWIIQFAVLECPPYASGQMKGQKTERFLDTVQHLAVIWSKHEFVQSTPLEQQACILCHKCCWSYF